MMNAITIEDAKEHNLKNVCLRIPLGKLVAVVGKSGSGKSSFVYDVLYKASQGKTVKAEVGPLPEILVIEQRVKPNGTMSLGEANMTRLKKSLLEAKRGDLLIADEPCAGMAKEDRKNVLSLLKAAVKKGVSIIVVEHAKDIIANSDYVIEFGPESGAKGGEVVFAGSVGAFKKAHTPTSAYVFSNKAAIVEYQRNPNDKAKRMQRKTVTIKGITKNHLKDVDFTFHLGSVVCVSGRMGTGKTTLLSVVYGALCKGKGAWKIREGFTSIEGKTNVRRSYFVDQSSLSSISTSTPATYVGIWGAIKKTNAGLSEREKRRLTTMTVDEAAKVFAGSSLITRKLGFLQEVGLGYLELGQKSNTLSGGEAQRVRLAKILSKKLGDRCIYILDIPSRGLHLSDLPVLMKIFQKIIDKNNTVLIAENREEVIANCDEVITL